MSEFKKYRRTGLSEMRPYVRSEDLSEISVSLEDSPDTDRGMVARNPKNHDDQWYVARQYFEDNFEPADTDLDTYNQQLQDEARLQWRMEIIARYADHAGLDLVAAAEQFKKAEAILAKND